MIQICTPLISKHKEDFFRNRTITSVTALKLKRKKKERDHEVSSSKVIGTRGSRRNVVVIAVVALTK